MTTILYAEDNPEHRLMVHLLLKDLGISLVEAADGEETLEKIETETPDLILLDLYIPKIDGYELLKLIKSNPETSHIPIIVLTAWPGSDNRHRVYRAGGSHFIPKPFDPFELAALVEAYLTLGVETNLPEAEYSPGRRRLNTYLLANAV